MPPPPPSDFVRALVVMEVEGLAKAIRRFDIGSANRGLRYARDGHVRELELDQAGGGFAASVKGSATYRCEWIEGPTWINGCTCPLMRDCKHAYAAACVLLAVEASKISHRPRRSKSLVPIGLGSVRQPPIRVVDLSLDLEDRDNDNDYDSDEDDFEEEEEEDYVEPVAFRSSRTGKIPVLRPIPVRSTPARKTPVLRPIAATSLPKKADPLPLLFEHLHAARSRDQRLRFLSEIAAAALVPASSLNLWHLAQEEDADICCSRMAMEVSRLSPVPLPPAIEIWRVSEAAGNKLLRRCETMLQEQLEVWAQRAEQRWEKSLRVVIRVKARAGDHFTFELDTLQTSAKLRDASRRPEQLRALLDEAGRRPGVLSPAEHALLDWICTFHFSTVWWSRDGVRPSEIERLLIGFGHTGLLTWHAEGPAERFGRAGIREGDPARLSRQGASIEPACTVENGTANLQLRVRLGDLRTCTLDEVLHFPSSSNAEPSYLLAKGELWRVEHEPPTGIFEGFRTLGQVTLSPERRVTVLRRLAPRYPDLAQTLERHTARIPSRAVFLLDGDSGEDLHLRLLAVGKEATWPPQDDLAGASGSPVGIEAARENLRATPMFEFTRDGTWQRLEDLPATTARPVPEASFWHEMNPGPDQAVLSPGTEENDATTSSDPSRATAAVEDAWLVEPDFDAVAPAVSWLLLACPAAASDATRWTIPLRGLPLETLAAAWEQRPRDAGFFATRRAKRLLGEGLRPMPRLDIRSSGKDFFEVKLDWQLEGKALSQADLAAFLASDAEFVKLGGEWVRAASREETREALGTLADMGIDADAEEQRLGLWQLAAAPRDALARLEKLGADPATVAAAQTLRRKVEAFRGLPRVTPPRTFRGELRGYQRDGLDFLAFTASLGSGAVLADDMGLGKTVQTLAWLERLRLAGNTGGPALVVCPASVVHNWLDEAARFAPRMRTAVLRSGGERHELLERSEGVDLFLTNYSLLRIDAERWNGIALGALILDEAQNVKNPDAAVTKAVRSLRARHRLALTGTPLENRTRDLWSIVECVSPGYFGTRKRFEERFERTAIVDEADRRLLSAKLRPLMLRRRKGEVAPDLPARTEEVRRCELTTEQRRLYLVTLRASRRLVGELSRKGSEGERARIQILAALTKLRQICCHPGLVDPKLSAAGSAKFDLLMEVLEPLIAEGHKVLVFSQFARCIQLIAGELQRRQIRHFVLTGATQKRERVVAAFQECEDPAVFLISLKAGGTGLNLTAASYVMLFDPWWNPAVEAQAIDRTHRIGQTKPVMAYRLVAADTIEEKILELQREKASLADAVVDDATFGKRLGKEDLALLLEE